LRLTQDDVYRARYTSSGVSHTIAMPKRYG